MGKVFCKACGEIRKVPFQPDRADMFCPTCGDFMGAVPKEPSSDLHERDGRPDGEPGGSKRRPRRKRSLRERQPERDWTLARAKVEAELRCRFCGLQLNAEFLQCCHVIGRERDQFEPITFEPLPEPWLVVPDRIVPGCAPCHKPYDHNEIDLIGKLTLEEELQAVRDCFPQVGRGSGIENARQRCAPLAYRRELAA